MKKTIILAILMIVIFSTACAKTANQNEPAVPSLSVPVAVRLPVGYIPNVQFAPLYVAIEKGFYRDLGLEVEVDYSMENDNAVLLANDNLQFAILSGEQVLLGRDKQLPLVYVMAWYQQYPVGIVSKTSANIQSVEDLKGKKIGLPGLYGASYIGAIAMLETAGLSESDVVLDSIGYNQVEALAADRDDAVVVYAANEPVQLEALGYSINLVKVSDVIDLVANGLVTNEKTMKENPELVKAMVAGTLQGIQYTIDHPDEAFEISKKYVENLATADQAIQQQVLQNSIDMWRGDPLGFSDPEGWENMLRVLIQMGLVTSDLDLASGFTNEFLP